MKSPPQTSTTSGLHSAAQVRHPAIKSYLSHRPLPVCTPPHKYGTLPLNLHRSHLPLPVCTPPQKYATPYKISTAAIDHFRFALRRTSRAPRLEISTAAIDHFRFALRRTSTAPHPCTRGRRYSRPLE
ncbi:hypothetical protein BaRGS_00020312 [Batillaria attramentaria]|uniref:Uncharacterized protein n=1 Tax=Batillaria attramentaria TaxID=370345 RepID=A0ABD0KN35_9CAEN